jgi:hypothetical protein
MNPGDDKESDAGQRRKPHEITEREQDDSAGEQAGGQKVLLPSGQVSSELDSLADLEQRPVRH